MRDVICTRRTFLLLLMAAAGVATSSCSSYKELAKLPEADAQLLVRDGAIAGSDTTSIASIPWKTYFKDTKLQLLITEGLEKNFDMQVALSRIKQAEIDLSIARSALLPSVSAALQVGQQRTSTGSSGTRVLGYAENSASAGFTSTWELDLWGKLSSQSKVKYASYLSSVESKNLVQTTLVASIAKGYYNLLALDMQLKVTQETVVLLQKSAQMMAELKKSGQQNEAAVEQSNALLYSTQLSIPDLERQIREQENALSRLLNRKSGSIERGTIEQQRVSEKLSNGVAAQQLAQRPDVKQAELALRSAYASTSIAKANLYPSITISTSTVGFSSGKLANLLTPSSMVAGIVAGVAQPVFNRKMLKGNLAIAQLQQQESLLVFNSTLLLAGQEVSDILFGFSASLGKSELRAKQIASLTNAVEFTHDLLIAGEANYTEVLSAQQSLLSAQLGQVNDKLEQLSYGVNLYKALGGGVR